MKKMELYFLSVGYGEAIVLLDGTHCLVMDGGPGSADEAYHVPGTIRLETFLAQKKVSAIDYMICTHLHNDHISGLLETARTIPVREFWVNCWPECSVDRAIEAAEPECPNDLSLRLFTEGLKHFRALRGVLRGQNTVIRERTETRDYEPLWDGCAIRLFGMNQEHMTERRMQFEQFCREENPEAARDAMREFDRVENTCSLACSLKIGGWRAFLTGDLCAGWEERCADERFESAEVLKLTHHGQKDGMPQCLVEACDPEIFVMCSDHVRTFNSACDEVAARAETYLKERGRTAQIYTTGLLTQSFGTENGNPPCALCCSGETKPVCTPYYVEEGTWNETS